MSATLKDDEKLLTTGAGDLDNLEESLMRELERVESIFESGNFDDLDFLGENSAHLRRGGQRTMTAFEIAEAEGEREELQDRLQSLLSRNEENNDKMSELQRELLRYKASYEEIKAENESLKLALRKIKGSNEGGNADESAVAEVATGAADTISASSAQLLRNDFNDVEMRLAETRSRLARSAQALDDQKIARECLEKELQMERKVRMHCEKERDAYMAAYEASLKHFEMWAGRAKQAKKTTSGIGGGAAMNS